MTNVDRLLAVFHQDPTLWETLEGWDTIRARLRAEIEVWQMSEDDRRAAWDAFIGAAPFTRDGAEALLVTALAAAKASAPATDA